LQESKHKEKVLSKKPEKVTKKAGVCQLPIRPNNNNLFFNNGLEKGKIGGLGSSAVFQC